MAERLNIGAHMSIAGGIYKAAERGKALGCEAVQIFVKNNMQWSAKPLTQDDADRFAAACEENDIHPVVAHTSYLINLGSPDPQLKQKSLVLFLLELRRAERLRIPHIVVHPKLLETPKGKRGKTEWDVINLRLLRKLAEEDS